MFIMGNDFHMAGKKNTLNSRILKKYYMRGIQFYIDIHENKNSKIFNSIINVSNFYTSTQYLLSTFKMKKIGFHWPHFKKQGYWI